MVRSRALYALIVLVCATACGNAAGQTVEADPCEHHRAVAYKLSEDTGPASHEAIAAQVVQHPECWDADLVAASQRFLVQVHQEERRREAVDLWLARHGLGYPQD